MDAQTNLIQELGLQNLPDERRTTALERIGQIIYENTMMRVLEVLDERAKRKLDELIAKEGEDQDEKIVNFIKSEVPDADRMVEEEIARFRDNARKILGS